MKKILVSFTLVLFILLSSYSTYAIELGKLKVSTSSIKNGSINVPVNSVLSITFNKEIKKGTEYQKLALYNSNGNKVTIKISINKMILMIKPEKALLGNTQYNLVVPRNSFVSKDNHEQNTLLQIKFSTVKLPSKTLKPNQSFKPTPLTVTTPEPTVEPTPEPTPEPTKEPTPEPTEEPTPIPTSFEDVKPEPVNGKAIIKLNVKYPEGMSAKENGEYFYLYIEYKDQNNNTQMIKSNIMFKNKMIKYTKYFEVPTINGIANCRAYYYATISSEYVEGFLSKTGVSTSDTNYWFEAKEGSDNEISFDIIKGVIVSGKLSLPKSMSDDKLANAECYFTESVPGIEPHFSRYISKLKKTGEDYTFSTTLPQNMKINVSVANIFSKSIYSSNVGVLDTSTAVNGIINYDIVVKEPEKVSFTDKGIEKGIRDSLNITNEELYDYMINEVWNITINGQNTNDISELLRLPKLSFISITKYKNVEQFKDIIGKTPKLQYLFAYDMNLNDINFLQKYSKQLIKLALVDTHLKDISILKDFMNLAFLNIQSNNLRNIDPIKGLCKLEVLGIECYKNEDLSFLFNNINLRELCISGNYVQKDLEIIKDIKKLKDLYLYEISPNSDLSYFLELADKMNVTTEKGKGKEAVKTIIDMNNKIRLVISQYINASMTEFDKERVIHDYLALNTSYDYTNFLNNTIPDGSHDAYSVILNGVGVCDGYSEAFKAFMCTLGIECYKTIGIGNGGDHAWNYVKINGIFYFVDVTWDDPVPDMIGYVRYDYFNVSSDYLKAHLHSWDDEDCFF